MPPTDETMFAQVLRGRVSDAPAVARQFRRWAAEVAPGGPGWRDVTGGVTAEGTLIAVTRFASEDDARANGDRDAQDRWWKETRPLLAEEPAVYESTDLTELWAGAVPDAGFVQMMLARVADRGTLTRIEEDLDEAFRRWRPDALGGYRVWLPDGRMLAVDYFSSEAEARAGERSEPPPDVAELFPEWMAQLSDQEWFDLPSPWIAVS
ncbi:MAG TPA: hypothetical protein VHH09_09095 [Acidimicrobiales bacterium]|nr:hypothetical protein [Acidimicrobiales bacterium]